jgi:CelD/BcsL family acetyltransferase involved in cellulose biosynthesis
MKTEVIETIEGFQQLEPSWNNLLQASGSNTIFLTHEWLDAYLRTIAKLKQLAIIVARDGDTILGIAPLMLQKREGFTLLYPIGHEVLDYEDFIINPDSHTETFAAIFAAIMKLPGWSLFQINKVREDSPNLRHFHQLAQQNRAGTHVFSVAPYLAINAGFDDYWSSLKKSFRNDVRRRQKRMAEIWGEPQYTCTNAHDEQISLFETLVDFHVRRRSQVKGDFSILEKPERRAFYHAIIEKMAPKDWLHVSQLRVDRRPVAVHLGFKYGRRFYYYLPTFDVEFDEYAVGHHLLKMLLEECFNDSCSEFDFLLGNESYKLRFNPIKRQLYSFSFFSKNFSGRVAHWWWGGLRQQLRRSPLMMRSLPLLYKVNILKTNT